MKVTMFMGTKINVSTKAGQKSDIDNVPGLLFTVKLPLCILT